jgi:CRP-like cAMP-binding protein
VGTGVREPVSRLWIDRPTFEHARQQIPWIVDYPIRIIARRLRHANAQVLALATLRAPDRGPPPPIIEPDTFPERSAGNRGNSEGERIDVRFARRDLPEFLRNTSPLASRVLHISVLP